MTYAAVNLRELALPALILGSVLWGLSWLPLKAVDGLGVNGVSLVLAAYGVAAALTVPLLWAQRARWRGRGIWLLPIALIGGYANLAFTLALIHGEVVRVMVLFYLLPVWGALGGWLFLGEHIDRLRLLAVATALSGAFLILGGPAALEGQLTWIDFLAVTSGLTFALSNLLYRAQQDLPIASKMSATFCGSAVLALVTLWLPGYAIAQAPPLAWSLAALYGGTWLMLAMGSSYWGVTHMEVGRSSVIIILELLTAVASAVLIGGERMSAIEIAGGALVLTAALLESRRVEAPP
ncbi:MAG: DMT family transporter [Thiotrichales bacterium]